MPCRDAVLMKKLRISRVPRNYKFKSSEGETLMIEQLCEPYQAKTHGKWNLFPFEIITGYGIRKSARTILLAFSSGHLLKRLVGEPHSRETFK